MTLENSNYVSGGDFTTSKHDDFVKVTTITSPAVTIQGQQGQTSTTYKVRLNINQKEGMADAIWLNLVGDSGQWNDKLIFLVGNTPIEIEHDWRIDRAHDTQSFLLTREQFRQLSTSEPDEVRLKIYPRGTYTYELESKQVKKLIKYFNKFYADVDPQRVSEILAQKDKDKALGASISKALWSIFKWSFWLLVILYLLAIFTGQI
jgi:hypothetical protein